MPPSLVAGTAFASPPLMLPDLAGTWHNQHGSIMELTVDKEGLVRGRFTSAVGPSSGEGEFRITGFVAGELITLSAEFAAHDSVTGWVGHRVVEDGEERIETLWHMAVVVPGQRPDDSRWKGIWSGADVFHRGPASARTSGSRLPSHPTGYPGARFPPASWDQD